jgi:hypothetical protein
MNRDAEDKDIFIKYKKSTWVKISTLALEMQIFFRCDSFESKHGHSSTPEKPAKSELTSHDYH